MLRPLQISGMGTALTFASPFVFLAAWARRPRALVVAAWASVTLALLHMLGYYNNGWVQPNAHRFALDFFPALLVLRAEDLFAEPAGG